MTEALTTLWTRPYKRRGGPNRADKALRCARAGIGPASFGGEAASP